MLPVVNNHFYDSRLFIWIAQSHIGFFAVCFPLDALPGALTGGEGFQN